MRRPKYVSTGTDHRSLYWRLQCGSKVSSPTGGHRARTAPGQAPQRGGLIHPSTSHFENMRNNWGRAYALRGLKIPSGYELSVWVWRHRTPKCWPHSRASEMTGRSYFSDSSRLVMRVQRLCLAMQQEFRKYSVTHVGS